MLKVKQHLDKKDKIELQILLEDLVDYYSDFYITKNNLRLAIKENKELLFDCIKKGDKYIYQSEKGIIIITGYSDKATRKYIKILSKDNGIADRMLKVLFWHNNQDLYIKIKKNNPIRQILLKNNFKFLGDRGKELLLYRKYIKENDFIPKKDEGE